MKLYIIVVIVILAISSVSQLTALTKQEYPREKTASMDAADMVTQIVLIIWAIVLLIGA
jgi:hypothetical protein